MSKRIFGLFCVIGLLGTQPVLAAKQDYKCFINSSTKGEQVVFYRWDSDELLVKAASLVGKQRKDSKGKKYFIKSVEECVPLNAEFSSKQAKAKDKLTLR